MALVDKREKNFAAYPIIIRDIHLFVTTGSNRAAFALGPMLPKASPKY
jgi:hypothetical protein